MPAPPTKLKLAAQLRTTPACGCRRRRCSTCTSSASTNTSGRLLNILETIALYRELREQPGRDVVPRVKIFAGKAAASYDRAKLIIKLINDVAAPSTTIR